MRFFIALLLFVFFVFCGGSSHAASGMLETLTAMNRIKPLQHPDYDRSAEILDRRVLGRKNKVLGEVRDVVLNNNGNIVSLQVEFDRLGKRQPVYIGYSALDAAPVTNGYILGFEDSEVENLYPTLLANIETAGGDDDEAYSLRKIPGAEVRTPNGQRIGKITDVLFGANGDRAEAFYVTMEQGRARGKGIAIPYTWPGFTRDGAQLNATVSEEEADAMVKYASEMK